MTNTSFNLQNGIFLPFSPEATGVGVPGQFTTWSTDNKIGPAGTPSGALLDQLTGFSGTGFLQRTGAGAYSFSSAAGASTDAAHTWSLLQTFASGITVTSGAITLPTVFQIDAGGQTQYHNAGINNVFVGNAAGNLSTSGSGLAAFGNVSMSSITSGIQNTSCGYASSFGLTSGSNNTAVGAQALQTETTGNGNIAIGPDALLNQNGGSSNTVIGANSGQDITTGSNNTLLGNNTGRGVTTGQQNTIIGSSVTGLSAALSNAIILADGAGNIRADYSKTTSGLWTLAGGLTSINLPTTTSSTVGVFNFNGASFVSIFHNNLFVGQSAGNFTLSGTGNNGLGTSVFASMTSGSDNVSQGNSSSFSLTTGSSNTIIGSNALVLETTGGSNVAIGKNALLSQNGAGNNVGIGFSTGSTLTTGANNTLIGNNTGGGLTTGQQNTVLGANVTGLSAALSNSIIIADGIGTIRLDYGKTTAGTWRFSGGPVIISDGGSTVAALPAASSALKGAVTYVTDATSPTFLGTLTGGGAVVCPVFCNGTAWVAG